MRLSLDAYGRKFRTLCPCFLSSFVVRALLAMGNFFLLYCLYLVSGMLAVTVEYVEQCL